MLYNNQELKALIDHEKRNLRFYALLWNILLKDIPEKELDRRINIHLDRLIYLLRLKG